MSGAALALCFLSQEYPPHTGWGGIGVYNHLLATSLAARGHRVTVVSRHSPGAPAFARVDGVDVYREGASIARKRFAGRTLDRILHARAVHRRVAALHSVRPFDIIESPEAAFDAERIVGDPIFRGRVVVQCHGSNAFGEAPQGVLAFAHRADWRWSLRHERRLLLRAARVIAPSRAMAILLEQTHHVPARRISVVPHGVDVTRFAPAVRPARPLTVGFAARLERRKGLDAFWKVAEAIGPGGGVRFRLKGQLHPATAADTTAKLRALAGCVEHEPPGSHDQMPAFYRSIDVLLQPSRFESFGLAYAEAMACEVVVLAGGGGAGPEIVTDGVDGFVVDADRDVERMTAIIRRLAGDDAECRRIGAAARETISRRFALERSVDAKLAVYERLLAEGHDRCCAS